MRVLLAPDCFGGTLTAPQAAQAMADGWRRARPNDELVLLPMSDGGPGFVDVLPGERRSLTVEDPLARPVEAVWRLDGSTAYVECAQACGLHLLAKEERDPGATTTYGVGQLVRAAVEAGATQVVLGLGGAGMLAALGVRREDAAGERLAPGALPLLQAARLVGGPLAVPGLVVATDVDAPLLGPHGASRVFGPQKGAGPALVDALETALGHWADLLEAHLGVAARDLPGAGAAGGLGFAALALGARREPGVDLVARAVGLPDAVAGADLVLTGEGAFDQTSLRGKVASGVARAAQEAGLACVVLAGQVSVGRREAAAAGVEQTYSLAEEVGLAQALDRPAEALATVADHVARDWGVG